MKKRRQISFFFLAFLVIFGVAIVGWFNLTNRSVKAAWFDDSWGYRKAITVTVSSSASDILDLDTLLTIDTTGITAKLQTSCQDLRFTNQNGKELKYFIDSCSDNSATNKIWVRVDLVPKNTTTYTIYMYYGNPGASSESDSTLFTLYNGLTNYWTMNESSWTNNCSTATVIDSSVNANSAKSCPNSTGPTGGASGQFGNAGTFDGSNDYLDGGNGSSVNLGTSDFTINLWVKRAVGEAQSSDGDAVIGKGDWASSQGWAFYSARDAGLLEFQAWDSSNKSQYFSSYTGTINDGTWHMLTIVQDRDVGGYFYLDGVYKEFKSTTFTGDINSATSLNIGHSRNAADYNHGGLDDVRMYNRMLSVKEIESLYSKPGIIASTATATSKPSTSFGSEETALGPVGFWRFNEGQGTSANDSSQNGNLGTLSGATTPTWQTEDLCVFGKCLYFNGSTSYVDLGTGATLNTTTGNFTLSAWIRTTQTTEGHILSRGSGGGANSTVFRIGNTAGKLNCRVSTGAVVESRRDVNDGQWHYVACSIDRSGLASIYIDGSLDHSVDVSSVSANSISDSNWAVGVENLAGKNHYFNGFIDEPKIYNYARSAAQIKLDYLNSGINKGTATSLGSDPRNAYKALSQGLVGYWKLDETSGNPVDSSGNATTLTNNNTATFTGGQFGNAGTLVAASSQYFSASDNNAMSVADGSFTLSAWVNVTTTTNSSVDSPIFTKVDNPAGTSATYEYFTRYAGNYAFQFYMKQAADDVAKTVTAVSFGVPTASTWHFFVAWYDSLAQTMNIQIDNGPVDVTRGVTPGADGTSTFRLGTAFTSPTDYYGGKIDEARIYSRVLSGDERSLLYNYAPGPIGYWQFEERTGTSAYDSSGNGNTGTLTNSPSWTTGKFGAGLGFAGSNAHVIRADDSDFDFGTGASFSYSAWIKHNTASAVEMIIDKYDTTAGNGGFKLYMEADGDLTCGIDDDEASFPEDSATSTAATYDDNSWHYVSCVKNGTTGLYLYIDGVLIASDTTISSTGDFANADPLYIGIAEDGTSNDWIGSLDEVRIYNYARTSKQVVEDMNGGHPAGGSPVGSQMGYWKFDEGQGTVAYDLSPQSKNGTLTGMASPASVGISGWNPNGKVNKALSFDGSDDKMAITTNAALSITGQLTISAWIKMQSTTIDERVVISKWNSTGNQRGYALTLNSTDRVCLTIDSDGASGGLDTGCSSTALNKNTWYHVVAVFNPSTSINIYLNGKLDGTLSTGVDSAIFASTADFQVGGSVTGWNNLFAGDIDEVKVYNYSLTQNEINVEYNRGQAINFGVLGTSTYDGKTASNSAATAYCVPGDITSCNAPVAEWNFEQRTGTSALDTSGNGLTGTLTGAATWGQGKFGAGLSLAADGDYVTIADNDNLDFSTGDGTIETWVNCSSAETDGFVVQKRVEASTLGYNVFIGTSNLVRFQIGDGTNTVTNSLGTVSVCDNAWHQIVMVIDRTNNLGRIYIDGVQDRASFSISTVTGTISNTQALELGRAANGTSYLVGRIDATRLYKYARTPAQIAYSYNRGLPVSWWKMDECQGTVLNTSSGTASATLTIGASGTQTASGTCSSSATTVWYGGRSGKINYSINLDGNDDYAASGNIALITSNGSTTKTASWGGWFYPTTGVASKTLIHKNNEVRLTTDSSSRPQCEVYSGSWQTAAVSPTALSLATWTQVLCTYDGVFIRTFVNGVLVAKIPQTGNLTGTANSFTVGRDSSSNSQYFEGKVDEVKLWSYALTEYQAKVEFNQGSAIRFGPVTGAP